MKRILWTGIALLGLCGVAAAQEYKVLKTFTGSDGGNPYGTVLVDGGKIYGMTSYRATLGMGTVFSMDLNGSNHTILHSFSTPYSATDGAQPQGDLIRVGDELYGMTLVGGANHPATGSGVVFRMGVNGSNFTLLHTFSGSATDGSRPYGSLSYMDGQLYGMTSAGGTSNTGALFRMDTNGASFSVLHSFASNLDGKQPFGDLLAIGDRLYGTASAGGTGNVNGAGLVFSIGTNGAGFQVMHDFRGGPGDGNRPMGSLLELGGMLYGMTENGGSNANRGTIFRLNADGSDYQVIHDFAGGSADGSDPYYSDLVAFGDTLYGMTLYGGTNNYGTLFGFNTNGGDFAVLHSFRGSSTDGRYPYGGLELADGVLYGMTANGGPSDVGTIFSWAIPEAQVWVALALCGALLALVRRRPGR